MSITTGKELYDFMTLLNGGVEIDITLSDILVDNAKAMIEGERTWMVLRKTDMTKSVAPGNTWEDPIDLSTISDFSQFYNDIPIRLFDGKDKRDSLVIKPFEQRLIFKDSSWTAIYDENARILYLNGDVAYAGILWITYKAVTPAIDLESGSAVWTEFPSRYLPILAYYAVGINKGAIDYDSINRLMLPSNTAALEGIKEAMEKWDDEKQLTPVLNNDPTDLYNGPRERSIDRDPYGHNDF